MRYDDPVIIGLVADAILDDLLFELPLPAAGCFINRQKKDDLN